MPDMTNQAVDLQKVEALEHAAALVRQARQVTGDTQIAFADRLGVSQSLLSKYERGTVSPPAAVLVRCMEVLHLSVDEVSQEELLKLVRTRLAGREMNAVRAAIANVITCIPVRT